MVYWSASNLNSGASPFCMLKNAMVWPVSWGVPFRGGLRGWGGEGGVESGCNRRLQIVQAPCGVALRDVLGIDRTIHLLIHLEVLMDGVARKGIEGHVRAGHLERPRRQVVDIGDADIGTERDVQTRAARAQEEFVSGRQARIDQTQVRRHRANASQIRRRQRSVELLF